MTQRQFFSSITFMFRELPMPDRFRAAANAGFSGVEIQFLDEAPLPDLVSAREECGLPVRLVNCDMGDFISGGAGLSGVPGRESAFRSAFERSLTSAEKLGATFLHIGPSRLIEGMSEASALQTYELNLAWALDQVQSTELTLLVEPANGKDTPRTLQSDFDRISELVSQMENPKVGLLLDTFHCAADGRPIADTYANVRDIVKHIQLADWPGRTPLGAGEIRFPELLNSLEKAGYNGGYGIEYMVQGLTTDTFGWMPVLKGPAANGLA